ncbi:MBL fold metallo-hydrolase [Pseudoalteromonas sp. S16_S37]|uniref:MBL fold metallo-hydrolase n=1 Tax=Pseudoalteromonas sp. S16_S37 TaxID=2720228 RepID=UPI0016812EDF|nr:MBL fold metallo-hydrolase [Pseudoalteromonas sp. S16_S37]MBD1584825.1 Zn-dependent hydrolase [Pseudoalteromonas sp. S16_S37]
MKYLTLLPLILLCACSTPNHVTNITSKDQVVTYSKHQGYEDRFDNFYKKPEQYPFSCETDCYPSTALIECKTEMEQCKYVGENKLPYRNLGYEIRWLGHATFVIKTPSNETILIDPVKHQFDWPVDLGFRLLNGFYRNEVPWPDNLVNNVDAVIYSHIHYDHFSKETVKELGNKVVYFTPKGFADHFPNDGYNISEMLWFTKASLTNSTLHFVPAHHFSSRVVVPYIAEDHDASLWGGWVIESNNTRLFYAGDTGYSSHISEIAKRFKSFDICLMPIASYFHETAGKWYRKVHMTPEDALYAADELNCKVMIPWGYGNASWKMGDKSSHAPLFRLLGQYQQLNSQVPLIILNEGEHVGL